MSDIMRVEFLNTYTAGRVASGADCSKLPTSGQAGNLTKYCLQSRYYSCAVHEHCPIQEDGGTDESCKVDDQTKLANFFPCAENAGGGHSSFADARPCAKKFGLDLAAIDSCAVPSSDVPVGIMDKIGNATDAAKPTVQFFPDIRVGGQMPAKGEDFTTAAGLIKGICKAYKGNSAPAAC